MRVLVEAQTWRTIRLLQRRSFEKPPFLPNLSSNGGVSPGVHSHLRSQKKKRRTGQVDKTHDPNEEKSKFSTMILNPRSSNPGPPVCQASQLTPGCILPPKELRVVSLLQVRSQMIDRSNATVWEVFLSCFQLPSGKLQENS